MPTGHVSATRSSSACASTRGRASWPRSSGAWNTPPRARSGRARAVRGAPLERFLHDVGGAFLATYPAMEVLRMSGRELPFRAVSFPSGGGFASSEVLFARSHDDHAVATLDLARSADGGVAV